MVLQGLRLRGRPRACPGESTRRIPTVGAPARKRTCNSLPLHPLSFLPALLVIPTRSRASAAGVLLHGATRSVFPAPAPAPPPHRGKGACPSARQTRGGSSLRAPRREGSGVGVLGVLSRGRFRAGKAQAARGFFCPYPTQLIGFEAGLFHAHKAASVRGLRRSSTPG